MRELNVYKNGRVYNNVMGEYVENVEKEMYLPSLLSLGIETLRQYFKKETIIPLFRILILRPDESIEDEISEYVTGGSIDINKQSGQTRNSSLSIFNFDGHWKYGARNTLYEGMKIRIDSGVVINNVLYWSSQGIFLIKEPTFNGDASSRKIELSLCDKWGLWDGGVFGNTELKTIIPAGVPINQVFNTIVHEDNNINPNTMWDTKDILFDMSCSGHDTYYTIRQDAGKQKSELMLDMSKTIAADISYDTNGYMHLRSNMLDFKNSNYSPIWRFEEGDIDCTLPSLKYNKSKYYNKITTKGAILNGYQFTATIENTNKKSIYNIYDTPVTPKVNSNSKLFSDQLCLEQCMYEMVQQSRGLMSASMSCAFLPFLDIDKMVYLHFPSIGLENQEFVIDGISFNLGTDCKMSLKLTSNNEVVF